LFVGWWGSEGKERKDKRNDKKSNLKRFVASFLMYLLFESTYFYVQKKLF